MDETLNNDTLSERPTLGRTVPEEKEPEGPARTWTDEDAERKTLKRPVSPEEMTLAGRYKVLRRLGEGGMGSVWLAEDLKLDGRKVAVKMLPSVLAGKKAACKQVKQEALVAMKLSHSNIAMVRAFEEEDGNPFLVMDYIEGEGLDDILAEKGKLSEEETLRLLTPVADALDYAHAQGVVHRDVKPGNIIVRKDGTPFVLDFGIAREIQETLTRMTGKFAGGTLLYMSPEQLRGRPPKATQDVYSFAVVAYECLTGHPPFYRGGVEDQIKNEPPEELPAEIRNFLRHGVMAGLAKEPKSRPDSCAGVLGREEGRREEERETETETGKNQIYGEYGFLRQVRVEEGAEKEEIAVGYDSDWHLHEEPRVAQEFNDVYRERTGEERINEDTLSKREEEQDGKETEQEANADEPVRRLMRHTGKGIWYFFLTMLVLRFVRVVISEGKEGILNSLMDSTGRLFWGGAVVLWVVILVLLYRKKRKQSLRLSRRK